MAAWLTWLTNGCFPAIGLLLAAVDHRRAARAGIAPTAPAPGYPTPRRAEAAPVARRRARTVCPQNAPDRGRRRPPPRPDALLHRSRAGETRAISRRACGTTSERCAMTPAPRPRRARSSCWPTSSIVPPSEIATCSGWPNSIPRRSTPPNLIDLTDDVDRQGRAPSRHRGL